MDIIYLLAPLSLVLVFLLSAVFWRALRRGQFDDLQAQHVRGAQRVSYLQQLFVRYLAGAPDGLRNFAEAVESYATFLWNHMEQEENRVLPLAEKHLKKSDWQEIDAAFRANSDPLGGADVQREFVKLKQRITNLLARKLRRHARG